MLVKVIWISTKEYLDFLFIKENNLTNNNSLRSRVYKHYNSEFVLTYSSMALNPIISYNITLQSPLNKRNVVSNSNEIVYSSRSMTGP